MGMRRRAFTIAVRDGKTETRKGFTSSNLGIHKNSKGSYTVTHLNTGFSLGLTWGYLKDARLFVYTCEEANLNGEFKETLHSSDASRIAELDGHTFSKIRAAVLMHEVSTLKEEG